MSIIVKQAFWHKQTVHEVWKRIHSRLGENSSAVLRAQVRAIFMSSWAELRAWLSQNTARARTWLKGQGTLQKHLFSHTLLFTHLLLSFTYSCVIIASMSLIVTVVIVSASFHLPCT